VHEVFDAIAAGADQVPLRGGIGIAVDRTVACRAAFLRRAGSHQSLESVEDSDPAERREVGAEVLEQHLCGGRTSRSVSASTWQMASRYGVK
jgi:hypothetical protein